MKCYIYQIINQVTQEKYVGQTTNFSRRKENHLSALKNNHHPNQKLQNAWNKYGEDSFCWVVNKYDISKAELDSLEKEVIAREKSFSNGYNLTEGGTGGNTRFSRIINFEQFCFIYAGNIRFDGMTNKTAKHIGCDSSTVSAIKRGTSYDDYREAYELLPEEKKKEYLDQFMQCFELDAKSPPKQASRLEDEQVVDFLCLISLYGKGAETAFLRATNHSKGLGHQIKTNKSYFVKSKQMYNALTDEEIKTRAEQAYENYAIQSYLTYKLAKKKQVIRVDCAL